MKTAASAPSVAVATGAVQNVGLPTIQKASSGPSVRRRNSRAATPKEISCAASRTPIAPTLRTLTSKLQPASTDSSPMPTAELEPEQDRDVRQQPAAGAEAEDECTEERERCDHSLFR